jgi:membrane-associated phospholipid phosphatase
LSRTTPSRFPETPSAVLSARSRTSIFIRPLLIRPRVWGVALLASICAILVSVAWLDRPIAYFVNDAFGQYLTVGSLTGTPSFFNPLAVLVFLVFVARRSILCPFGRLDVALILTDLSIVLAKLLVGPLKVVFGRTWPQYHTPSLIGDGTYGFNFFQSGASFESFPSGHMASICALFVVFWLWYPAYSPIYTALIVGMAASLVLGNYHFLSDVIGGAVVGCTTAVLVVSIYESWRAWRLRVRLAMVLPSMRVWQRLHGRKSHKSLGGS